MSAGKESNHLKITIVGHVDHGKSTVIGRLFYETGSLPEGKFESIKAMCDRRGMPFEWAFLMDALKSERDQGITIDAAQIHFSTPARHYTIIDAPGHKEFLKNMITGAANASAALLVIDAKEGVREQSKRHGFLLSLLGIKQVAVLINKMDLVDYSESRYNEIVTEYTAYLQSLDLVAQSYIPISAREGDLITAASENMPWYKGDSIVGTLDQFTPPLPVDTQPLRFPVQDVYKFDDRRIIAGRIESGTLNVGDELVFSPSNKSSKIHSIEWFPSPEKPIMQAKAGQSVGITLEEQIFVERGDVASLQEDAPFETRTFRARLFWIGKEALTVGQSYKMKLATAEIQVRVEQIERVVDVENLSVASSEPSKAVTAVKRHEIADVIIRAERMCALDDYRQNPIMGRFVLVDGYEQAGGGIISTEGYEDQRGKTQIVSKNITRVDHQVTIADRATAFGHKSGILWFTGLSGSGKSTLAIALETELFNKGYKVYVLDGDNIRHGLCSDLGFSPEDRTENIRRVGEVAKVMARAGFLVITAFISPYEADRERVRQIAPEFFHEVHIQASLETCESRDAKGLYKKARAGEIKDFTGISAPYEAPVQADLVIDTNNKSVNESVHSLIEYVDQHFSS